MDNSTVWYTITNPKYKHCKEITLVSGLPKGIAEKVAAAFAEELMWVTRLNGDEINVWID